ncbi:Septum formation protein Maf [hydrothermal vent metagenome]|uniref:Septum formation protein Maf n=1 Tax=hydrothermal vent metagenome TaxID=652676 RepID=A0A1W1E8V7_9ZZZZ
MLCLCSQSQSRALLLRKFDIDFVQKPVDFDEDTIATGDARTFVYLASKGKLEAAQQRYGLEIPLLTADSVIATSQGKILRKPKEIDDARRILRLQSGAYISIVSAMHYKSKERLFVDLSATHYHFAPFDEDDLEAYLQSGEWQGKAGGCMVEGFCKKYIQKVKGYESTAMGLSVETLLPWIRRRDVHQRA